MGLLPHPAPAQTWSADVYSEEYRAYTSRLGVSLDLRKLAPQLWLPTYLQNSGWHTGAWVSMPVLNEGTLIAKGFDHYRLRDHHNDLAGIIDDLRFYEERPSFWLLNTGETHYPYEIPGNEYNVLPRLSGVHGAVKRLSDEPSTAPAFFSPQMLRDLQQRQVDAVSYIDTLLPTLRAMVPPTHGSP